MPVETTAAVLRAFREPHALEEVELRDPGPGEVLVRIHAAGVCHSDVGQADGDWAYPLPAVLGHEGAGVVEAVGDGVATVAPGDRVVLSLAPGCAMCRHCVVGRPVLCQDSLDAMGAGRLTTGPTPILGADGPIATYSLLGCFAGRVVVAERSCIPLPDGVPAAVAALVGCAVITGAGAALRTIEIEAGSAGAVVGAGGVGVNAIQGARIRGAGAITAFDASQDRLERAVGFGATGTVEVGDEGALAVLRAGAPRGGLDWTIVTVGAGDAIRLGIDLLRPGGVCCVVGLMPEGEPVAVDMLELVTYEKRVVGSAYGTVDPRVLVPRLFDLYLDGRLRLDELVSDRFPLDGIDEAFDLSRRAGGLRPVLELEPAW
jgi:S-(hydroxymethyl)glutathione dehydrogenase/alcohol dehydrogenase